MNTKKYLIVLVLKLLESESDKEHPLTQLKIAEIISEKFPVDRKTVGRNIKYLKEIGYPIVKTPKGFYLDSKKFTKNEVDFIIDAITNTPQESIDKNNLIARLKPLLEKIYRS